MGQIANQMAIEFYLKMKKIIKEKVKRKKDEKSHREDTGKERNK